MTIQISVTIWTIICFLILMLVLSKLLFKPVLTLMDKRKERIDSAKIKKTEIENIKLKHSALLLEKEKEFEESEKAKIKAQVSEFRKESRIKLQDAKNKRINEVDEYRKECEKQHNEILDVLSEHADGLAKTLADRLLR